MTPDEERRQFFEFLKLALFLVTNETDRRILPLLQDELQTEAGDSFDDWTEADVKSEAIS